MPSLMATLGIERLTTTERLQLIRELLDSLATEPEQPPLPEAQRQELDRRIAALDANPNAVSPWSEVEARILARLRQ